MQNMVRPPGGEWENLQAFLVDPYLRLSRPILLDLEVRHHPTRPTKLTHQLQ